MNAITARPVDRHAIIAEHEQMRHRIFIFGCYSPDKTFTLDEVAKAFGYDRHKAWVRINELKRKNLVRILPTTANRCIQYQIATED